MQISWEESKRHWSNGENILVNGMALGSYYYDPMRAKGDHRCYSISTALPLFTPKITAYQTADEAKAALEAFTKRWFARFQ